MVSCGVSNAPRVLSLRMVGQDRTRKHTSLGTIGQDGQLASGTSLGREREEDENRSKEKARAFCLSLFSPFWWISRERLQRRTHAHAVRAAVVEVDLESVVGAGSGPLHGVGPGTGKRKCRGISTSRFFQAALLSVGLDEWHYHVSYLDYSCYPSQTAAAAARLTTPRRGRGFWWAYRSFFLVLHA